MKGKQEVMALQNSVKERRQIIIRAKKNLQVRLKLKYTF